MKVCVVVFLMMVAAAVGGDWFEEDMYRDAMQLVRECGATALSICLKEKALKFIERLPHNIDMGNGIRITQNDSERLSREYAPINFPDGAAEREEALDRVLWQRVADYLSSHTIEFKIPMSTDELTMEEARKRGGKKGGKKHHGMMPLMMLFMLKAATIGALALKLLALLAFKALLMAKVALTISAIIALKKLVESKHHGSTYEVVAHPHVDDYSHYDRAFRPDLVYKGLKGGS